MKYKKHITILGDSLSMVRVEDGIKIREIYPYKLIDMLADDYNIFNKSKRGNTIINQSTTQNLYDDIETTETNILIIQLGICDCSPRLISKFERFVLNNFTPKLLRKYYLNFKSRHRHFFTKYFPKTYVKKHEFEKHYHKIINVALKLESLKKIILINIADTNKKNKLRSFGFEENIKEYNKIIHNLVNKDDVLELFDLYKLSKNNSKYLLSDGIHINYDAHELIANQLYDMIKKTRLNDN